MTSPLSGSHPARVMLKLWRLNRLRAWGFLVGRIGLEQTELDSLAEKLSRVRDPHLQHHGRAVSFDGPHTDPQTLADVAIHESAPHESQYFLFTGGDTARLSRYGVPLIVWGSLSRCPGQCSLTRMFHRSFPAARIMEASFRA
jgi:hypothetical protein